MVAVEAVRLVQECGLELTGLEGLVKRFMKDVLEAGLTEEMTEWPGHAKH